MIDLMPPPSPARNTPPTCAATPLVAPASLGHMRQAASLADTAPTPPRRLPQQAGDTGLSRAADEQTRPPAHHQSPTLDAQPRLPALRPAHGTLCTHAPGWPDVSAPRARRRPVRIAIAPGRDR